ncbi:MAG: Crp/Fnr family transcriptional regulator, partial [Planctomycetota bacterium]
MRRIASEPQERMKMMARCGLFWGLDSVEMRALAGFSPLREYEREEVLFHEGQTAEGFDLVVEGKVKVCRFGPEAREQVLHLFGPGEPVGEVAVFEGKRYPATAVAVGRTRVLHVPRDKFVETCRKRPEVLMKMLAVLSTRLRRFVQLVDDLALKEVSARLAKHLLDLSARSRGSKRIELDTTKAMLASRLGTIAETLSRTLAKMQRKRILKVQGRKITVLKPAALQGLAAGG